MNKPTYNFAAAQEFTTKHGATKNEIANSLRDAALRIVNATWDEENRGSLIYDVQCAATDVLDFLDRIIEMEVEQ